MEIVIKEGKTPINYFEIAGHLKYDVYNYIAKVAHSKRNHNWLRKEKKANNRLDNR